MKILLVVKSKTMENLGPMYLSSVAKSSGHECVIKDISEAEMFARIWKPNIIGYSIMTGDQKKFEKLNSSIINWWDQGKPPTTIVGGPHVTFFQDDCRWADILVHGEAEGWLAEYLGSEVKYDAKNVNSLPWPDRTDFPDMRIRDFISSRGCPYGCKYCFNSKWLELYPDIPKVRTRSVDSVIDEINSVNPDFVYFQDSCFGVSKRWMSEFSRKYRSYINIPYHCHLRPAQATEEMVILLRDSNCLSVRIALETASARLRKLIGRGNTTNEDAIKAARVLRKWDIRLMIQNILGLPTSTIEDDLHTLEVNIKCRPAYGWCSIFTPYPGTELGDMCKNQEWYSGDYSEISDSFFDDSVLNFTEEHKEQLYCLQKIFALCVETQYVPSPEELTKENFLKLVHKILRTVCDRRLYGGVI